MLSMYKSNYTADCLLFTHWYGEPGFKPQIYQTIWVYEADNIPMYQRASLIDNCICSVVTFHLCRYFYDWVGLSTAKIFPKFPNIQNFKIFSDGPIMNSIAISSFYFYLDFLDWKYPRLSANQGKYKINLLKFWMFEVLGKISWIAGLNLK